MSTANQFEGVRTTRDREKDLPRNDNLENAQNEIHAARLRGDTPSQNTFLAQASPAKGQERSSTNSATRGQETKEKTGPQIRESTRTNSYDQPKITTDALGRPTEIIPPQKVINSAKDAVTRRFIYKPENKTTQPDEVRETHSKGDFKGVEFPIVPQDPNHPEAQKWLVPKTAQKLPNGHVQYTTTNYEGPQCFNLNTNDWLCFEDVKVGNETKKLLNVSHPDGTDDWVDKIEHTSNGKVDYKVVRNLDVTYIRDARENTIGLRADKITGVQRIDVDETGKQIPGLKFSLNSNGSQFSEYDPASGQTQTWTRSTNGMFVSDAARLARGPNNQRWQADDIRSDIAFDGSTGRLRYTDGHGNEHIIHHDRLEDIKFNDGTYVQKDENGDVIRSGPLVTDDKTKSKVMDLQNGLRFVYAPKDPNQPAQNEDGSRLQQVFTVIGGKETPLWPSDDIKSPAYAAPNGELSYMGPDGRITVHTPDLSVKKLRPATKDEPASIAEITLASGAKREFGPVKNNAGQPDYIIDTFTDTSDITYCRTLKAVTEPETEQSPAVAQFRRPPLPFRHYEMTLTKTVPGKDGQLGTTVSLIPPPPEQGRPALPAPVVFGVEVLANGEVEAVSPETVNPINNNRMPGTRLVFPILETPDAKQVWGTPMPERVHLGRAQDKFNYVFNQALPALQKKYPGGMRTPDGDRIRIAGDMSMDAVRRLMDTHYQAPIAPVTNLQAANPVDIRRTAYQIDYATARIEEDLMRHSGQKAVAAPVRERTAPSSSATPKAATKPAEATRPVERAVPAPPPAEVPPAPPAVNPPENGNPFRSKSKTQDSKPSTSRSANTIITDAQDIIHPLSRANS